MSRTDKTDPYHVRAHIPDWQGVPHDPTDQAYLRQQRKRQRRADNQVIRTTRDWDAYTHPHHPYPAYYLPSW